MSVSSRTFSPEATRLLNLAADYILEHGVSSVSLSQLSRGIGTSNRMLLYYFGSKRELIGLAIGAAQDHFPKMNEVLPTAGNPENLTDQLKAGWRALRSPENLPMLRLFFEGYSIALRDPVDATEDVIVLSNSWPTTIRLAFTNRGYSPEHAELAAQQLTALWRGLQLSLLAGVDVEMLDTCHDEAIDALYGHRENTAG